MADKYEKIKVRAESGLLVTKFKDKRTGKIYNQRPVFDPTKSKVSSRLNLGISKELKALQAEERLRLSELPTRSLPTNFTGGAIPNRQSLQNVPSTQDLIDVQRESDLVQAFNMAKSNTGEVQFPNLRPKASELAIPPNPKGENNTIEDTNKLQTMEVPATTGSSYLKEWTTDMPLDAESVKIKGSELKNREQLKTNTGNFDTLSVDELKKRIGSGGRNSVLKNKMKLALMNKNIEKIQRMSELGGDG